MIIMVEIDFYEEGGSLFVRFKKGSDITVSVNATVLIDFLEGEIASVEILFHSKEDVRKVCEHLSRGEKDG